MPEFGSWASEWWKPVLFVIIAGLFITWPAIIGWISLIIGIVTLAVGVGLWRGNHTARTIATIVFAVAMAWVALLSGKSLRAMFTKYTGKTATMIVV